MPKITIVSLSFNNPTINFPYLLYYKPLTHWLCLKNLKKPMRVAPDLTAGPTQENLLAEIIDLL